MTTPTADLPRLCAQSDADLWTTDSRADRMRAAAICRTCPALADCFAEAESIRTRPIPLGVNDVDTPSWRPWGVWAAFAYDGSGKPPEPIRELAHGTNRYRQGCRCEVCVTASRAADLRKRQRRAARAAA